MAYIGGFYIGDHESQFDGSPKAGANCTPTSVANGADDVTRGKIDHTGGYVRALVTKSEETNPDTPGWSIPDAVLAAKRMGLVLVDHSGKGWDEAFALSMKGYFIVLQGDSDQFPDGTCSDKFDGDHCIGWHPATRLIGGLRQHVIQDPICDTWRWEYDYILRRYAVKFRANVNFAAFEATVPKAPVVVPVPPSTWRLHIQPHALIRVANFRGTCIRSWTDYRWGVKGSSAPCKKPVRKNQCNGTTAKVALVTAGKFTGKYVHIGAGVTATEEK